MASANWAATIRLDVQAFNTLDSPRCRYWDCYGRYCLCVPGRVQLPRRRLRTLRKLRDRSAELLSQSLGRYHASLFAADV